MTEPDSLRRAGHLPRDKDGWDVGTVRIEGGRIAIRRHGPKGDDLWGVMKSTEIAGEYEFESNHPETTLSNGIKGDEGGVFGAVVKGAGGSLPKWDYE